MTPSSARKVRVLHFNAWAEHLEDALAFVNRLPAADLSGKVANHDDPALLQMARLDADWHGETTRCLASLSHPGLNFLPARVTGVHGLLDIAKSVRPPDEEWWLVFEGQHPQKLAGALPKLLPLLQRGGIRFLFYAFDEASRTMGCFNDLAPYLSVLIHDESPLDAKGRALLGPRCLHIHRSWVANVIPFSTPFNEAPSSQIVFLGSRIGLTEHRQKQLAYLQNRYGEKFVAIHDHSVPVAERGNLNRYKVSLCPEGRKFLTSAMGATHTDRPFWSGCLGMVPVAEDSRNGGRLEALADAKMIVRYEHGDLDSLGRACDTALATSDENRRRLYDYFNRNETVGKVVADAIFACP